MRYVYFVDAIIFSLLKDLGNCLEGTFNGWIPQKDFKLFKEAGEAKIGNNTVYGVTKL